MISGRNFWRQIHSKSNSKEDPLGIHYLVVMRWLDYKQARPEDVLLLSHVINTLISSWLASRAILPQNFVLHKSVLKISSSKNRTNFLASFFQDKFSGQNFVSRPKQFVLLCHFVLQMYCPTVTKILLCLSYHFRCGSAARSSLRTWRNAGSLPSCSTVCAR